MRIDWDVPLEMDDGLVLRADVFRPIEDGRYAVLLSYGPYAKGLHFEDGYPDQWRIMCEEHPDVPAGSTNAYQTWEVVDPEKWVPDGYVCVRVDSRGAGRSPGYIQHFSPRETQDFHDCIEWAGEQEWSNGKVGLSGISYYAMNQWQGAATQPQYLPPPCAREGAARSTRRSTHHGGPISPACAHGLEHWTHYYTDYGRELQKAFFDHFLQGEDNGWDRRPSVLLNVRHADGRFERRDENEWPLARTAWTKLYLDPAARTLEREPPA